MRPTTRTLVTAILLAGALTLAACSKPFPETPNSIGEGYPSGGIPVSVAWPSDWLDGFAGEPGTVGGSIMGLRLDYVEDRWMWRVRSVDPGRDILGESVTEPDRGRESLFDARTLALVKDRSVTLSDAERAPVVESCYDAAQLSGEVYPSPRLVGLERQTEHGRPVWKITTYDTETGDQSTVIVDAS